ncbi:MAG: Uma2 family endonuclease [Chloroflexi bacterium]|nr:Uma2 family endonuclease [Chloroflexota bacterium]
MATVTQPATYRWTRQDFLRLGELGFFDDANVELIDGEIVTMAPIGPRHAAMTFHIAPLLERIFPDDRYHVRSQAPLALGPNQQPQPDLAVVAGAPRDYLDDHPASALLVVELADATLAYDTNRKADLYATGGIEEYWVVDLAGRTVEVFRQPVPVDPGLPARRYASRQRLRPGDTIAPLAAPDAVVAVADLLP